jgi:flagellar protein FlaG
MEVRNIGQGGQASFDNMNTTVDTSSSTQGAAVQTPVAVNPAPVQMKDNNQTSEPEKPVNEKELKKALDKLTGFLKDDNTTVDYQFHNKFNDLIITIRDKDTNQVILEVPPKKILDLVAKMMEMVGVIFDKKA